jgi:hypothetical protein
MQDDDGEEAEPTPEPDEANKAIQAEIDRYSSQYDWNRFDCGLPETHHDQVRIMGILAQLQLQRSANMPSEARFERLRRGVESAERTVQASEDAGTKLLEEQAQIKAKLAANEAATAKFRADAEAARAALADAEAVESAKNPELPKSQTPENVHPNPAKEEAADLMCDPSWLDDIDENEGDAAQLAHMRETFEMYRQMFVRTNAARKVKAAKTTAEAAATAATKAAAAEAAAKAATDEAARKAAEAGSFVKTRVQNLEEQEAANGAKSPGTCRSRSRSR